MEDSVLPLLDPQIQHNRRHRGIQWYQVSRYVSRRRLKFYLILLGLFILFLITIIHKNTINETKNKKSKHLRQNNHDNDRYEGRTMKTIIGRYVGPKPEWMMLNVSHELLNSNNYDPDPEVGRDGRPAYLTGYPKERIKLLYTINRFNLVASDKISVDRKLPDPRKLACRSLNYDLNELPKTTIIIVFHNEAWSTLARTVHSILNTAPKDLLREILLVDDASNRAFLEVSLDHYMNNLSSVRGVDIRVIRSKARVGLIRARLIGVAQAKGPVLTFIDAHCEATKGWLEPLLEQIKINRKTAACPIIDIINEDTFAFTRSFELHLGAINWGLNFRWFPISRRELIASNGDYKIKDPRTGSSTKELIHPFQTPAMAGGLFSIDKSYFEELGSYDPQMDIWGGENIELSFRMWQCGGQVKIVPCSHVAHVFRKSSPYTFRPGKEVGDILYTNLARVAEVWMDEWKKFFYMINPSVNRTLRKVGYEIAFKDIDKRKELRQRLKCNNFQWYLDNVWPEHFFPQAGRFFGKLRQVEWSKCVQRPLVKVGMNHAALGALEASKCHEGRGLRSRELFLYDAKSGFIKTDENLCLDSGSDPIATRQLMLVPCMESSRQKWIYNELKQHIVHSKSQLCVESPRDSSKVQLQTCQDDFPSLRWVLEDQPWNVTTTSGSLAIDHYNHQ